MKKALVLMCLLAPLAAAAGDNTSAAHAACMEKSGGVTSDMQDCIATELVRRDARLNKAYKAAMAPLSAPRKKQLLAAQRAWLAFRDANCQFYADPEGGSAARLVANDCVLSATANRATELEDLTNRHPIFIPMTQPVHIAGVGMTPFAKPGAHPPYPDMAAQAVRAALADAGLAYTDMQQAYVGYVYGDSTAGQRALYGVGMTGIPIFNVNNNCATGSTALFLARQAVASGAADCVLALGFEHMNPGALDAVFTDRPSPFDPFDSATSELVGRADIPLALRYFGGAGQAHMQQYGTQLETFAAIRAKASRHAAHNPMALLRKELTTDDVMAAPMLWDGVMTRLMACPPTCGAAAAVVCSESFARQHGLNAPVRIRAQAMTTDTPATFEACDMRELVGFSMAADAAQQVYKQAGVGPEDLDVVELHDCFAQNELISYEALGLCPVGGAERFVLDGENTYGGAVVTNPSGGLLSKGHPLGATGLAQCTELVQQLRGQAGLRQVPDARLALQHNLGLGGACVVTLYERA